ARGRAVPPAPSVASSPNGAPRSSGWKTTSPPSARRSRGPAGRPPRSSSRTSGCFPAGDPVRWLRSASPQAIRVSKPPSPRQRESGRLLVGAARFVVSAWGSRRVAAMRRRSSTLTFRVNLSAKASPFRSKVHSTAHVATGRGRGLLGLVGHDGLGGEEQTGDRGRVQQRRTGHLHRVADARGEHVDVLAGGRVEALADGQVAHLVDHDARLEARVERDLLERRVDRDLDDVRTGRLVAVQRELLERRLAGLDERDATTGDDALLAGRLRVADGVLDAVLALLELDLGGRARLDDGDAARELGEALLELLAVVVGVGVVDLLAQLLDAAGDGVGRTGALDDRGLVLGDDDLASLAEQVEGGVLELETDLLRDDLAAREDRDVLQLGLAAGAEAGGLDGDRLEDAADLVHDERGQGLPVDVLGDDEQLLASLDHLVDDRQQVLDVRDLAVDDQDVRVFEDRLLTLRVGHEVRRQVALVEAHALGEFEGGT